MISAKTYAKAVMKTTFILATLLQSAKVSASDFVLTDSLGKKHSALLLSAQADIDVNGLIVFATVTQKYLNSGSDFIAGEYVFPLPEGASIDSLIVKVAGRVITSELKEKQQAIAQFEQAKKEGKRTALLSQDRPNLFRMAVANIPAGETIEVIMSYLDTVHHDNNNYSLRLPTTLTPRYSPLFTNPDVEKEHKNASEESLQDFLNPAFSLDATDKQGIPKNPIALNIDLNTGFSLRSLRSESHSIDVQSKHPNIHQISLRNGVEPMDRDFVLQWQQNNEALAPTLYIEQNSISKIEDINRDQNLDSGAQNYMMLSLVPTADQFPQTVINKDISFVIDTSGSMGGESIREAKTALQEGLQLLNSGDSFNVIEFNSVHRTLFEKSRRVDSSSLAQAMQFVDDLVADGGTEMRPALLAALRHPASSSEHVKQVVFITDGAVGNESALSRVVQQFIGDARLFFVSIGSAPNGYLFNQLAAMGKGTSISISSMSEVKESMQRLFKKISTPAMRNIQIVDHSDNIMEIQTQRIPDLYFGEPLQIMFRSQHASGEITVKGDLANQSISIPLQLQQATPATGVAKLWAKQKIRGLLNKIHLQQGSSEIHRQSIVDLSLQHNILSQYTSFVAVDHETVRRPSQQIQNIQVANLLPQGMAFPRTALGITPLIALSLISLLFAGLIRIKSRRPFSRVSQ